MRMLLQYEKGKDYGLFFTRLLLHDKEKFKIKKIKEWLVHCRALFLYLM
jgi:hypothetical protein